MFAALFFERDPLQTTDLLAGFFFWLRYVGGLTALGLVLGGLATVVSAAAVKKREGFVTIVTLLGLLLAILPAFAVVYTGRINGRPGEWGWVLGSAFVGLLLLGITFFLLVKEAQLQGWRSWLFVVGTAKSVFCFGTYLLILAPFAIQYFVGFLEGTTLAPEAMRNYDVPLTVILSLGGLIAVLTVAIDFSVNVVRLRWRRIWALTMLTCNEVRRNRILWAFLGLAVVFLFGTWFIPAKPESQVYVYVQVVFIVVSGLMLATTSLTASFGLHNDIKNQTIHTVLTKPVERFEVVLGRFFGYTLMMTLALLVMLTFSLIYLVRGVHPTAQAENLKARVPIYGQLAFEGTQNPRGENVGEEWEYRGYISGPMPGSPTQYAIWHMENLPADLASRDKVPLEFTFSIYRTTTGDIRGGVLTAIEARSWRWQPGRKEEFVKRAKTGDRAQLARTFGFFSEPSISVTNGVTQTIQIPAGVFQAQAMTAADLQAELDAARKDLAGLPEKSEAALARARDIEYLEEDLAKLKDWQANNQPRPPLQIVAQCIDRTQFVGMAKYDLYLLDREQPFALNFYKGATGIWLYNVLVIGLGVVFSTYLNGVVSWLCAMFLLGIGLVRDYVQKVAEGTNEGGGPARAWLQLIQGQMPSAEIPKTPTGQVASFSDEAFRWFIRGVLNMFPDVARLDFSDRVSNGFDLSLGSLAVTALFLLAYLVPWMILSYYLIRSREIASST